MNSMSQYLKEIDNFPQLSKEEQLLYLKQAQKGDNFAKEILINSNLKLVVSIAKKYSHFGIPLQDLIQEGSLGLIKSIDKFNLDKNTQFSTYAVCWIKQGIFLYLKKNKSIVKFPIHARENMDKVSKFIQDYTNNNRKTPSDEEISIFLGISIQNVILYRNLNDSATLSFEANIADGMNLHSIISSNEDCENSVMEKLVNETLYKYFDILTPKEKNVIIGRYGLFQESKKSLDEIGKSLNLTKERIRQIQTMALKKLESKVPSSLLNK